MAYLLMDSFQNSLLRILILKLKAMWGWPKNTSAPPLAAKAKAEVGLWAEADGDSV